jgi:PAS domain S-box-containing protein
VLAAIVVLASFWISQQIRDAAAARTYTHDTIRQAEELLASLTDAETGQRGYLLTLDDRFLAPYLAAADGVSLRLADLRQRSTTAGAGKHLTAVAPLVGAKMTELAEVIALQRSRDVAAAQARVAAGRGKRLMDSLRGEIRDFVRLEEAASARNEEALQSRLRLLYGLLAGASLCTLLLALSFVHVRSRTREYELKALVHDETQRLLELQEGLNHQLRQTQATLQVSENQLAVTLQSIGDAVIATDAGGLVTLLNPFAEQLTGWTQEHAMGRPVDEILRILDPDTNQPSPFPVAETLAHGTTQRLGCAAILRALDGSERSIADSCAPIRDRDGQVVGAVLVFRDVTKENATLQDVRDNSALIQTILDTVADGIITLRASGGIVESANSAAERMFGYAAAELVGRPFSGLVPELDADRRDGSLEYYRASAEARDVGLGREVVARRKDGSSFPLEISMSDLRLGGKRYFTGVLRDITARKRSEEARHTAGPLQTAIFNSANFSSIATDAKGVIQIFNVGAERMLGYAAAEVMNKITPADISDPQEVIVRAKALSAELGTPILPGFEALVFKASRGIEDIYELTYIRKDGSRFPAVVSVTALRDAHNAILGYLLIGTDNTARKQIEAEQMLLAQRLRDHQFYTRSLFESCTDALTTTDPSGIITDVDISFIRDVTTNPASAAIAVAIIDMARSLKMEVVAEGVETLPQLEFLRQHGCDEIQGYYCARPMPAAELAVRREENRASAPLCAAGLATR